MFIFPSRDLCEEEQYFLRTEPARKSVKYVCCTYCPGHYIRFDFAKRSLSGGRLYERGKKQIKSQNYRKGGHGR
jgi:hypothetical protein